MTFVERLPKDPMLGDYIALSDETGISKHRYMIIGGISLSTSRARSVSERIDLIRNSTPFRDSLQWKRVNTRKLKKYINLINLFTHLNNEKILYFHAVVFDAHAIDHRTYSDGDSETGFYKFVYQSMFSHVQRYMEPRILRCIHGRRDTKYDLRTLTDALNNGAVKHHGCHHRPYFLVQHADVSKSPLLQLADVLIGAVGHIWNNKHIKHPLHPHTTLALHLQRECPVRSIGERTPPQVPHFDIWQFRMGGRGR